MSPLELRENMERLRSGKDVKCMECKKGIFKPSNNSDYRTTHGFVCSHCGAMINID